LNDPKNQRLAVSQEDKASRSCSYWHRQDNEKDGMASVEKEAILARFCQVKPETGSHLLRNNESKIKLKKPNKEIMEA
jgi:hypothetical protein